MSTCASFSDTREDELCTGKKTHLPNAIAFILSRICSNTLALAPGLLTETEMVLRLISCH